MKPQKKSFDCLEYKWKIQKKHSKEMSSLSEMEKIKHRLEWLAKSDNPAAKTWRALAEKKKTENRLRGENSTRLF